ncbi:TetR/AcrR family transcriptional regulator [Mycobacterium sp.]|uniref:TetR/AcrR family transcriptional regulator n=1 Tax=Mycobacterium sp. TaxID=1785 RepID=UPI003BAC3924
MHDGTARMSELIHLGRRRDIAEAARRLFTERGSLEVSVDEIAAEANVSRSTVYNHFADRNAILRGALEIGHAQLTERLTASAAMQVDPVDRLVSIFRVLLEHIDGLGAFYELSLTLAAARLGESSAAANTEIMVVGVEVVGYLQEALSLLREQGRLRDDLALEDVVAMTTYVLGGLTDARSQQAERPPPGEVAEKVLGMLLSGVCR